MIVTNTAHDQRLVPVTNEVAAGNSDLIVDLQRRRVEAKLDALGGFSSLQVRGAALSIRVTGTINKDTCPPTGR
jgi:hypothetical protein